MPANSRWDLIRRLRVNSFWELICRLPLTQYGVSQENSPKEGKENQKKILKVFQNILWNKNMRELYIYIFFLSGLQRQSFNFISYLYNEERFLSHINSEPCASENVGQI